ncbi:tyrosine-protein phosphatase [Sphingomonas azotifigens]|uniref:tyrosine-protein phosphatase n=1 Tax=Sphingomonas azotifigens TaxID=330920 RepID=UPI000A0309D1|nr:tyrosine-protein phosphatase [Sphingomonas azotifigens]
MRRHLLRLLAPCVLLAPVAALGPVALARQAVVASASAHPRLLPLEGGRNFRDLGGYRTSDGRTVKWGMLYRSGSMHGLTEADFRTLDKLGIRTVCDLRDRRERAAEPVHWPNADMPRVLSDDYDLDLRFLPAGSPKEWTPDKVRTAMAASYPRMLEQFNGQYRRMFAELLAGHAPLAFNCSAGKDRTGIAAALLLTALGVPRATVIDDYLLTNVYLDPAKLLGSGAGASPLAALPPAVVQPLLAADRSYIEAALAVVDAHPGGAEGYLQDALGLSKGDLNRLRDLYLTRG